MVQNLENLRLLLVLVCCSLVKEELPQTGTQIWIESIADLTNHSVEVGTHDGRNTSRRIVACACSYTGAVARSSRSSSTVVIVVGCGREFRCSSDVAVACIQASCLRVLTGRCISAPSSVDCISIQCDSDERARTLCGQIRSRHRSGCAISIDQLRVVMIGACGFGMPLLVVKSRSLI